MTESAHPANRGEPLYDLLKRAAAKGRDEWARNALQTDELFKVFTEQGGGQYFDYHGALVSGFSQSGWVAGLTVGVDFGQVLLPFLKLEGKVQVEAERCSALMLVISRFPRLHPGLSIAHAFNLACLTGATTSLMGRLSVELGWGLANHEKQNPIEAHPEEKPKSTADRLKADELLNMKCELKAAVEGALSARFRVLTLRDASPTCYAALADCKADFVELLGTATKRNVKEEAIDAFDLPGFPEAGRALKPSKSLFKRIKGSNIEYRDIKAALEAVRDGINRHLAGVDDEFVCAEPDKIVARIEHHLQMLRAFYAFDRVALEAARQASRTQEATLQSAAVSQGARDAAADREVDARLCHLSLFSHEESATVTPKVEFNLQLAGQGASGSASLKGELGYKFSGYRYQSFVRDFASASHIRAGKQVFDSWDDIMDVWDPRQGAKVSPLSEARRRTGRVLVRTQDTEIGYWTRQVKAAAEATLDVGTLHERRIEEGTPLSYNSMTYSSAVVYWRRQNSGVRGTAAGANHRLVPAEVGSGYSLGCSCDPRDLMKLARSLARATDAREAVVRDIAAAGSGGNSLDEAAFKGIFQRATAGAAREMPPSLAGLARALGIVFDMETVNAADLRELGETVAYAVNNVLVPTDVIAGPIRSRLSAVVGRYSGPQPQVLARALDAFDWVVSEQADPGMAQLTGLAARLNVPVARLQDFIAAQVGPLQAEVTAKTSAVLLESSFALDETHGFKFPMDMVPLEGHGGGESWEYVTITGPSPDGTAAKRVVPTPKDGLLKAMVAAGAARSHDTLQAIRLRVRRADTTDENYERTTKFKLGFKFVVEVGIELASIERAGHEAVVDLATHWVSGHADSVARRSPTGRIRPSERLKALAVKALDAQNSGAAARLVERDRSQDAMVPPVALLHQ